LFLDQINLFKHQQKSLIFLDESGFAHDMPRTQGYSFKGKRCYGKHDWGAKGRTNVIGCFAQWYFAYCEFIPDHY
jgi:hypothetical protein